MGGRGPGQWIAADSGEFDFLNSSSVGHLGCTLEPSEELKKKKKRNTDACVAIPRNPDLIGLDGTQREAKVRNNCPTRGLPIPGLGS